MIRPFGLNDVWLVRRLQHTGMSLAIEHALTHPYQPLWSALTTPWPWVGKGIATFVLDERPDRQGAVGFVQLMKRAARPEADLLYLASAALAADDGSEQASAAIWRRLLSHCCAAAANHGLQRIFAGVPDGCLEQARLKETGFSLYTRETIYRLAAAPAVGGQAPGARPQAPQDSWALQRLYTRSTPRLVQQAEGAVSGEQGSWWEPDSWLGIVWEPAGEVRGAAQIHLGRSGHWLRIWGGNELQPREFRLLIEQALRQIVASSPAHRRLPVYVTVRDYEAGIGATLIGFGFAPFMDRVRFVKHTVAAVREAAAAPLAGREVRQEVPLHSHAE